MVQRFFGPRALRKIALERAHELLERRRRCAARAATSDRRNAPPPAWRRSSETAAAIRARCCSGPGNIRSPRAAATTSSASSSPVACGLRRRKLVARVRIPAAAEQPLATPHLELVARVARRDRLHLGQRLQRAFGLDSVLAEWKLVIQMQVRLGRALAIAVGQRGIRKAQPDGGRVDGCVVENVFVDFRGVAESPARLAQRCAASASPSAAASPTKPCVSFSPAKRRLAASNRRRRSSDTPA